MYIQKEVRNLRDRGKEDSSGVFGPTTWSLPSHIIVFLQNTIEKLDSIKLKLTPWPEFKKIIFEIIDHRIEFAPEINGVINTSYLSLDEHLLIYMVDSSCKGPTQKSTKELIGTRKEVETKLVEFLYSLKYYSTRWLRAKTYAEMLGF